MFFFSNTTYYQLQLHNPCDMNAKQINWRQFTVKLSKKNKTVSRSKLKKVKKSLADNQTNTFPPLVNYLATVYLEKVSELS